MTTRLDATLLAPIAKAMPGTMFFLKNHDRRYLYSNEAHSIMCGVARPSDVIGSETEKFFSQDLSERYAAMDANVLEGHHYLDRFDCLPDATGRSIWTLFSRKPVLNRVGEKQILGISRQLPKFRNSEKLYRRLHIATEHMVATCQEKLNVAELAQRCECSVSQIERDFSQFLSLSPSSYHARLKLDFIKLRLETSFGLADIALESGFSDQSALSRFFKRHMGMTLHQYRKNQANIDRASCL